MSADGHIDNAVAAHSGNLSPKLDFSFFLGRVVVHAYKLELPHDSATVNLSGRGRWNGAEAGEFVAQPLLLLLLSLLHRSL